MLRKLLLITSFISATVNIPVFSQKTTNRKNYKTIVIDPGHGGKDQGAQGLITTEAAICLQISKKLGLEIKKQMPSVRVLFTRTTDIIPGNNSDINNGLRYRAYYANRTSADLFISIHCNSAGKLAGGWYEKKLTGYKKRLVHKKNSRKKTMVKEPLYKSVYVENITNGTETYIWTAKENEQKKEMIGSQNEFETNAYKNIEVPVNDPVINALKLIYTQKYFIKSLKIANLVQSGFQRSGRINRGVKQRNEKGIWVLHATGMPSILIETGFISNKKEEQYLVSNKGQNEIARSVTAALKKYLKLPDTGQSLKKRNTGPLHKRKIYKKTTGKHTKVRS